MSDFWKKYGPGIGFILIIIALLFVLKMQWDASKQRDAMNKQMVEMKQLQDGIVRNKSKYVSEEDLRGKQVNQWEPQNRRAICMAFYTRQNSQQGMASGLLYPLPAGRSRPWPGVRRWLAGQTRAGL